MISLTSPIETPAHRWPAGLKLAALCFTTVGLFFVHQLPLQGVFLALVAVLYALPGKLFFCYGLRQISLLWPFIVLVGLWHGVTGEWEQGGIIVLRLLSTVALANLVTMTTRLSDMIDVVNWLTRPLKRLGLNTRALELSIALVIRMTPVLVGKGQSLSLAWRARSNRRSGWRIILPFTVLALDDADHVAEALRARGGLMNDDEQMD
ncbi:energy-coupling factor transporter transmembrane component T family protein [Vibrio tritonius]|uniref:energy-coupling factor transporter transmembrane component T family protein n=1 Tax=Vibrio tritonius TaxID=1435069 RepID=UPI000837F169|nr:energy-coupling factor transporter transmembrane protein EcfT [Vibrio tritonius]